RRVEQAVPGGPVARSAHVDRVGGLGAEPGGAACAALGTGVLGGGELPADVEADAEVGVGEARPARCGEAAAVAEVATAGAHPGAGRRPGRVDRRHEEGEAVAACRTG